MGRSAYDRRVVSESILKIENVNHDSSGEARALLGFAISAKRYALYERDGDDVRIIDPRFTDSGISTHRKMHTKKRANRPICASSHRGRWRRGSGSSGRNLT